MNIYQMKTQPYHIDRVSQYLDESFVSIGFREIGDLTGKKREEVKQILADTYKCSGHRLGSLLGMLDVFVNGVKNGDILLVSENDWVHIGKFGDYEYRKEFIPEGLCHRRHVQWLGKVGKYKLNSYVKDFLDNRINISKFKHPYDVAEIDAMLTGVGTSREIHKAIEENLAKKATRVLSEALDSENIELRVDAALALLRSLK